MELKKRRGYAMLVNLLIVVIVMGTISSALAMQQSAYFTGLESGRTALYAQQLAAAKVNEVSILSYSNAASAAATRTTITGTTFERKVIVGPEVDLDSNNKKRDITVNIYKPGEVQARFSLPVTLTSKASNSAGVPVGTVVWYAAAMAPDGWLICNGQSTSGYPELAAVVGANVPDLRGEFIRGADLGRGVDLGRSLRSSQSDAIRNISGYFSGADVQHYSGTSGPFYEISVIGSSYNGSHGFATARIGFDASRQVPTADENRPRNVALLPCIKY